MHGKTGPVGSSFSNYQYPVMKNFFRGWNAIGVATQIEPNGGDANGAFYGPISAKARNQSRDSASEAYYRPIAGRRDNFHLIISHVVTKINFDQHKRATSVNNVTQSWRKIVNAAANLDPKTVVPADTDTTIIAGHQAQRDLVLDLYRSQNATVQEVAWGGGNTVSNAILKPLSRGLITINSTDPTAPPVFGSHTFSHPMDLNITVESIRKIREWMASAPMQEIRPVETYLEANCHE
ncbi:hypothetical protein LTR86_010595 [Recurvomyces mirabilis]|nr:hypothetical protein LTR86_010595 [Recurvomyces mirabilis]